MRNSRLLIAVACGVAVLVFGASLLIGPAAPTDDSTDDAAIRPELPAISGDAPAGVDLRRNPPIGRSQGGSYFFRHDRQPGDKPDEERWTLVKWNEVTPKPGGIIDVTDPRTQTYLPGGRVMTMEAARGTFDAPDNQPKRGDLLGDVVLRIFEAEPGREVDPEPGSPDLRTVVYLENAHFDLELALVHSEGPVHVTGADIDFRGRGLSLNYNQLRDRLERLEVAEGETMRFRRERGEAAKAEAPPEASESSDASEAVRPRRAQAAEEPAAAPPAEAVADASPGETTPASPAEPDAASPVPAPTPATPAVAADRHQYYRATFEEDVRVSSGGTPDEQADIAADTLAAIFSMDGGDDDDEAERPAAAPSAATAASPSPAPAPREAGPRQRRRAAAAAPAAPFAQPAAPPASPAESAVAAPEAPAAPDAAPVMVSERSLMAAHDDDVVIRWTGRLVVEPLERKPRPLAGPDDLLLTLTGEPVTIRTGRDETVTSRQVTFLASAGRVEASGSEDSLVLLESPQMGTVTGTQLVINQSLANGHVRGPGWLKGRIEEPGQAADAAPEEMEVAWTHRLDLTFYRADDRGGASSGRDGGLPLGESSDLVALRTAVFRGEVMANHPRFRLGGDTVSLALDKPEDGRNTLQAIESQGNVQMAARGEAEDEQFDITSEQLRITMERDAQGRPSPRRVAASGDVVANRPDMRLKSQQLGIKLAPQPPAEDTPEAPEDAAPRLAVERLVADGGVDVHLPKNHVTLTGVRLEGELSEDRLELFGTAEAPARVVQPEGTLVGERIVFGQESETVHVEVPGHLTLASLPGERRGSMRIEWNEAMRFSNRTGLATFTGGVRTTTESPTDRTRLDAASLDVQFEAATAADTPADAELAADPSPAGEGGVESRPQQVRTATARGDVRFRADRFAEGKPDEVVTQLSIRGPEMMFDNAPDAGAVHVIGAGRMGIVDNRPPDAPAAPPEAPETPEAPGTSDAARAAAPVRVSGRGATLFEWADRLVMNMASNDITLLGNVRMTHRPAEGGPPVFFDATRVVADLEEPTGEAKWLDDEAPQPEIRGLTADGAVFIRRESLEVIADRLVYTEADKLVVLTAEQRGAVQVRRSDFPVPQMGKLITWNLETNRFDVKEAVGTMLPVSR